MRRIYGFCLAAAAWAVLLCCGCAGILSEKTWEDGTSDRLRLAPVEKWSKWDRNSTKQDESAIMMKKELTF